MSLIDLQAIVRHATKTTRSSKGRGRRARVEVAGPYRSQSSRPAVRARATAHEHRTVVPSPPPAERALRRVRATRHTAKTTPERRPALAGLRSKAPEPAKQPKVRPIARQLRHEYKQATKAARGSTGNLHSAIVTTPEQKQVLRTVLREGQREGANRKEKLAAIATGLQESGMRNLPVSGPGGGWRQEESAFYPEPTNVKQGAKNFFSEAKTDTGGRRGRGETIPHLAQAVQASGAGESFYADNVGEAKHLLHQFNRGGNPRAQKRVTRIEQKAQRLNVKLPVAPGQVGPAPKKLVKRVVVAEHAMREIEGDPYVWGGGHNTSFSPVNGEDCSGSVSYVVHKLEPNKMKAPLTSGEMGQVLDPGPGAFTVFYNSTHTFIRYVNHKGQLVYWGTSVGDSGSGGLGPHPAPSASYLAQYNVGHIPGMGRKQALQLGATAAEMAGGGTVAGMTFSPSGTTATIAQGTTKSKPGFSRLPIRLTPYQKLQRFRLRKKSAEAEPEAASTGKESALATLERKYGRAA